MRNLPSQSGQVLILVTFSAFLLFSMLALAVDLGWGHYIKKTAQAAADAAALAAGEQALYNIGQGSLFSCGQNGLTCQSETACASTPANPPVTNLDNGCLYAQQNGYTTGGAGGRQNVTIQADVTTPIPTAPGVNSDYWVTVRVSQSLPMLFGAFTGGGLFAAARATAAVVDVSVYGSLILINHENDCIPMDSTSQLTCGVNLEVSANNNGGHYALQADGGIFLASQKNGTSADGRYAGENSGGGTVYAGFTHIRGSGWYSDSGSSTWTATPQNQFNANLFADPMRGKGQPAPPTGLSNVPVAAGTISGSGDPNNPLTLYPGNYYAVDNQGHANGNNISISGYVKFAPSSGSFGNFVFFGGVSINNPGTLVTFSPGRYIFAGVQHQGSSPGTLFTIGSNASVQDLTPSGTTQSDAGEIFVFTDTNYTGQGQSLQIPSAISSTLAATLQQGISGFQAGNNSGVGITVHGLNKANSSLPSDLDQFTQIVIWQDQQNSVIKYTGNGYIDTSCGNSDGCANTALANNQSPQLILQGSPSVSYNGTVYQPRGGWTTVQGGGDYEVPIQLVAGALKIQGTANFSMAQPGAPVSRRIVALVE